MSDGRLKLASFCRPSHEQLFLSGAPKADTFMSMNAALDEVKAGRKEGGDVLGVHVSQLHPQVLYSSRELHLLRRIVNGQHPAPRQRSLSCVVGVTEPARSSAFLVGNGRSRRLSSRATISLVEQTDSTDMSTCFCRPKQVPSSQSMQMLPGRP